MRRVTSYESDHDFRSGPITKAGNGLARAVLMEAAWCYRFPARVSKCLLSRQEGLPREVRDISWQARLRLCGRYRHLRAQGKDSRLVAAAIAREPHGADAERPANGRFEIVA